MQLVGVDFGLTPVELGDALSLDEAFDKELLELLLLVIGVVVTVVVHSDAFVVVIADSLLAGVDVDATTGDLDLLFVPLIFDDSTFVMVVLICTAVLRGLKM